MVFMKIFNFFVFFEIVMHGCFLLKENTSISNYFNDLEKFALVFSGLCHDVSHRGYTNNFEILSYSKLTVRYHDKSVKSNYL